MGKENIIKKLPIKTHLLKEVENEIICSTMQKKGKVLKSMYAILDIESTGGKYNEEGITEIAIYRFDGQEVVDQFGSLINPERKIQPFVIGLTGINNDMLRYAPKFYQVAKRIIEITEDCTIVAHNAKFDYRILRLEFSRLGYEFERKTLCTVELSKKLIPEMPSYSLGKLTKSLGIPIVDRHRAIGDAQATVKLFRLLLNKDSEKKIIRNNLRVIPKNQMGTDLIRIIEKLPSETGVYYMLNENSEVIYVGKSKNIKSRINQHFTKDNPKAQQMRKEVASVSYDLTGNQLAALLLENHEIKKLKPKFNRALKKDIFNYALYHFTDKNGYINLKIGKAKGDKPHITTFTSINQAKKYLEKMIEEYQLCLKLTGFHPASKACFNYGIEKCLGACIQKESPQSYNERVEELIRRYNFPEENLMLIGKGRHPAEKNVLLIENGHFKGMAFYDLNHQLNSPNIIRNLLTPMNDDRDARHIIQSYLRKSNEFKKVSF